MTLQFICAELERLRVQIRRRSGIGTASAKLLLARMQASVDALCIARDELVGEQRGAATLHERLRCDSLVTIDRGELSWRTRKPGSVPSNARGVPRETSDFPERNQDQPGRSA